MSGRCDRSGPSDIVFSLETRVVTGCKIVLQSTKDTCKFRLFVTRYLKSDPGEIKTDK